MAKKKAAKKAPGSKFTGKIPERLASQCMVFAGKGKRYERSAKDYEDLCKIEGARVEKEVTEQTDYLVMLPVGSATARKKAEQLNKKQQASILMLDHEELLEKLLLPDADTVLQLLMAGDKGHEHLNTILRFARKFRGGLQGCETISLRGLNLEDCKSLQYIALNGADLREANLASAEAHVLQNCDLRKAKGGHFHAAGFLHCDCREANLPDFFLDGSSGSKTVVSTDFSKANLNDAYFSYSHMQDSKFVKADLSEIDANHSEFSACDFTGADFSSAEFQDNKCVNGCSFVRASFKGSDLKGTDFGDSDLSRADFSGATLCGCDFSKATLVGANFEGAILFSANLDGADVSKAKKLVLPPKTPAKAGKACKELDQAAKKAIELKLYAEVQCPDVSVGLTMLFEAGSRCYAQFEVFEIVVKEEWEYNGYVHDRKNLKHRIEVATPSEALEWFGATWGHGILQVETVKGTGSKCPLKGKALAETALQAFSEVLSNSPQTMEVEKKNAKVLKAEQTAELLEELRGGTAGIKKFQARDAYELRRKKLYSFRGQDFTGAKMTGLDAKEIEFSKCMFVDANLTKVKIFDSKLDSTDFSGVNLRQAKLDACSFAKCKFNDANLSQVSMEWCNLKNTDFSGAKLAKAKLIHSQLQGANFENADLKDTNLNGSVFDHETRFPQGYKIDESLQYSGIGHDPRLKKKKRKQTAAFKSFDEFMETAMGAIDPSRGEKAIKMLKKDSFELFSEVSDDCVRGVVRSQSDKDLVYSCSLNSAGDFCCCTQNLNACGGLRGALCKHLLVLLFGLTKKGELGLQDAADWIDSSNQKKPVLDKDDMSAFLLKYKGAEAGELDWRPTETLPEDFIAF